MRESMPAKKQRKAALPNSQKATPHSGDSDIVSFWLLLLFVVVFFGIAAEEARRPMFDTRAAYSPAANLSQVAEQVTDDSAPEKKSRAAR